MGGICSKYQSQDDNYAITIEEELPIKQINKSERCFLNSSELNKMLIQQQRILFPEEQIFETPTHRGQDYFSKQSLDYGQKYTDVNLTPKGILKTHQSDVSGQKSQRCQKRVHFNKSITKGECFFRSSKNSKPKVTLKMLDSIF